MNLQPHLSATLVRGASRLALGLLSAGLTLLAHAAPTPFVITAPGPIDCDSTPFGHHAPLAQDMEPMDFIAGSAINAIDEYRPSSGAEAPPFTRVYRNAPPTAFNGASLQRVVSIDLNGDGRDELVAAYRMGDGSLKLGVFHRGSPPAATLFDTWALSQSFTQVELVAGDLDGSTNGVQELGVMIRTTAGAVEVYVLSGDSSGGINQGDNAWAGYWLRNSVVGNAVGFTAGDLLLDGHQQMAVVTTFGSGSNRVLNYDLLEYQSSLPISVLPVGSNLAIGSKAFPTTIGTQFPSIAKLEADAGDVVDSGAAELVLHIQYQESSFDYIVQRLLHFTTTRVNNAITGIALFSRGAGMDYDASQIVQGANENGLASFEAVIANVDSTPKREIVLVRADPGDQLKVSVYQPAVDRNAAFQFQTTGTTVNLTNTSAGDASAFNWTFGDGQTAQGRNAIHQYANSGTYHVTLAVSFPGEASPRTYAADVPINTGANAGGQAASYSYHLAGPRYEATYPVANYNDLAFVRAAAGDIDRDGTTEILTLVRDTNNKLVRSSWRLQDPAQPSSFAGTHAVESNGAFGSITAMALVASDFDGDSLHGNLAGSGCQRVSEPQVRQVVWLPPYFAVEQASASKEGTWGKTTENQTSVEKRSGSYVSHDVSGYIGVEVGTPDNLPYTVEASATFSAGHNWETSHGEIHGEQSSIEIDEAKSVEAGEALVVIESNQFDCYRYDVRRAATGLDPNSEMRMCSPVDDTRLVSGDNAVNWDTFTPADGVTTLGHKPAQWFPLNRDWSSLALFRPVTTNTAFTNTDGANATTDGKFSTEALAGAARAQPYVEIDLGKVQDISNIRVFPAHGDAIDLQGFRVYTAYTPMSTTGLPSGPGVTMFAPETEDGVSYDRWNIWTRQPNPPYAMLRARYVRLQHPGTANLRVAEIQVFGDVHIDPPTYPQAVCDPLPGDGYFNALVWNRALSKFASIEVRGDLIWNGSGSWPTPQTGDLFQACGDHGNVQENTIWADAAIGASSNSEWSLGSSSGSTNGSVTSFDSSNRVGANFDFKAGFIAKVVGGLAYEFTKGITREVENSSYWGTGITMGGKIGGFANPALAGPCAYRPRPYAYRLTDRSDTGYQHDAYTVDYVVQEGPAFWTRATLPTRCLGDEIFADSFD